MPLGLARDSMLNLAELASKTEDETSDETVENKPIFDQNENSFGGIARSDNGISEGHAIENGGVNDRQNIAATEGETSTANKSKEPLDEFTSLMGTNQIPSHSTETDSKPQKSVVEPETYQYAGFRADYHDFESYTSYSFHSVDYTISGHSSNIGRDRRDDEPWWRCIFPWMSSPSDVDQQDDCSVTEEPRNKEQYPFGKNGNNSHDDNMVSTGSINGLGEKLSANDSEVVLPRLTREEPDAVKNVDDGTDAGVSTTPKRKGILRHPRARHHQTKSNRSNASIGSNSSLSQQAKRRSLFPAYEPNAVDKKDLNTTFSPMARVVAIKSSKEMDEQEKSSVWWQKPDYDAFRKTGRMISKVMLQGGSEIWLATNQSWQVPNQGRAATLRHAMANVDNEDTSQKWWHKFGHSRRGLEHIASIDEGRQRQANVKTSIRAVLTEQRRQKAFHREDPEKLRMCSIQNTSWAKDLALASGASDADAVTKNFDEENRRSREFYLLKFSRAGKLNSTPGTHSGSKQIVPAFMKPMISVSLQPNRLDANTTSRIQFRKKQGGKLPNEYKRITSDLPSLAGSNTREGQHMPTVPIHDPQVDDSGKKSLASQAAGFANGEEAMNMSAVLTGMGPLPKSPDAAHARPVLA